MARRTSRRSPFRTVEIKSPGSAGLNSKADPLTLPSEALSRAENIRTDDGVLARRRGLRKVASLPHEIQSVGSWDYASGYALVPPASHLNLPVGGFWRRASFTIKAAPNPAVLTPILSSRVDGLGYGPHAIAIDDSRFISSGWRSATGDYKNTAGPYAEDQVVHLLDVFDPASGIFSTYIDGVLVDTTLGIAATERPIDADDGLAIAVQYDSGGGAPIADSDYTGVIDCVTLGSLRGVDTAAERPNGRSIIDMLVRWSTQEWPNPQSAMVVAHFGMNEADTSGGLIDSSRYRNHGTFAGTPLKASALAAVAACGNYVGYVQEPDGTIYNVAAAGGAMATEVVR